MSERITDALTPDALGLAVARRRPPQGQVHHSDRGNQYASGDSTTRRGPPARRPTPSCSTPSSATMGSGGIRHLAISVRERSSEGTNWTRRQLNPDVYHPGQVRPSEGSLAPRAGQT
jgi:hypothetical protein